MQSLRRQLCVRVANSAVSRCGASGCCDVNLPSNEASGPSTSGRWHESAYMIQQLNHRCYSTVPSEASAEGAQTGAPGSPSLDAKPGTSSQQAPFYAGLAQRYPDPDSIPEQLLSRLRNEIFGKPVRLGEKTGRRALARPLQGRVLADWYFLPPREVPGFHNEEREYEVSKALNRRHKKDKGDEPAEEPKAGGKKKK